MGWRVFQLVLSLFLSPDITVPKIVTNGLGPLSLCLTVHVPLLGQADWDVWWHLSPRLRTHVSAEIRTLRGEARRENVIFLVSIGPIPILS